MKFLKDKDRNNTYGLGLHTCLDDDDEFDLVGCLALNDMHFVPL